MTELSQHGAPAAAAAPLTSFLTHEALLRLYSPPQPSPVKDATLGDVCLLTLTSTFSMCFLIQRVAKTNVFLFCVVLAEREFPFME